MKRDGRDALSFGCFIVFAINCALSVALATGHVAPQDRSAAGEGVGLRDVFQGKEIGPAQSHRLIGRLGILLETDQGFKHVRHDYLFRSGDRFRFEVTSSQVGWLYLLHTSPGGKVQQLWPGKKGVNEIRSGQTYEVPPSPGVFIFDKETGDEFFYVAIRADQTPPVLGEPAPRTKLSTSEKKAEIADSKAPINRITNFRIRDPFGGTDRGVVFDPGLDDTDTYLYFSAVPQDSTTSAMIEFQLHHVK